MMDPKVETNELEHNAEFESDNIEQVEMDMEKSDEETPNPSDTFLDQDHTETNEQDNVNTNAKGIERPILEKQGSRIVQVLNVSPNATLEQFSTFFGYLGDIIELEFFQQEQNSDNNFKVCFIEFADSSSALLAQHLTNTVFIDRALIVIPYGKQVFPDKETALATALDSKLITNFDCGFINQVASGINGAQVISTINPRLTALGLTQYPNLPINTEPARIEEIRRTVYIGNLDSSLLPEQVLKFFNDIGEVKYIRMAGDDTQPTRFAFVEYMHQSSIANALQHNGAILGTRALKINHSNNAIVKPQPKVIEIDDGSKKSRDIHSNSATRDRYSSSSTRHDRDHKRSSRDREKSRDYDRQREHDRTRDRSREHNRLREHDKADDHDRLRNYDRDHGRDRYHDRHISPRDYRSRRSRSREITRRRSRSRDRTSSRRDRSKERDRRKRSRSRDTKRRSSKDRSEEHSKSKRHRSRR